LPVSFADEEDGVREHEEDETQGNGGRAEHVGGV